ncbi:MAG TPA: hypothetical protein VD738_00405 [Nitrospira sp.]|nr:hypothetical protein [Nitrospira sp.]
MKSLQSGSLTATLVSLSLASLMLTAVTTGAQSHQDVSSSKTVTGKVSKVVGEFQMAKDIQGTDTLEIVDKFYVIMDQSGNERRLTLDDDTKVRNRVNPGDRIEAKISPEGHTLSVTRLE